MIKTFHGCFIMVNTFKMPISAYSCLYVSAFFNDVGKYVCKKEINFHSSRSFSCASFCSSRHNIDKSWHLFYINMTRFFAQTESLSSFQP